MAEGRGWCHKTFPPGPEGLQDVPGAAGGT